MDTTIKKENGIVFTPEWGADFILETLFKACKIDGNEKVLNAGCGEGVLQAPGKPHAAHALTKPR